MRGQITLKNPEAPLIKQLKAVPFDWPDHSLTQSFDNMDAKLISTFANARKLVQPIIDLDAFVVEKLPEFFDRLDKDEVPSSILFARMFSMQRVSARHAFSGQSFETRAVLRAALECAVYGWALKCVSGLRKSWIEQDAGRGARDVARRKTEWGKLVRILGQADFSLGERVVTANNDLSGYSVHPSCAELGSRNFINNESCSLIREKILEGRSGEDIQSVLLEYIGVARLCIEIFELTFRRRPSATEFVARARAAFDEFELANEFETHLNLRLAFGSAASQARSDQGRRDADRSVVGEQASAGD